MELELEQHHFCVNALRAPPYFSKYEASHHLTLGLC